VIRSRISSIEDVLHSCRLSILTQSVPYSPWTGAHRNFVSWRCIIRRSSTCPRSESCRLVALLVLPVVSGCISVCDIAGVVVGCNLSSLSLCTQLDFSRVAHISGVLHRLHYRLAGICGKFILVESLSSFDIDLKKI